jgi:hypothetical protein
MLTPKQTQGSNETCVCHPNRCKKNEKNNFVGTHWHWELNFQLKET